MAKSSAANIECKDVTPPPDLTPPPDPNDKRLNEQRRFMEGIGQKYWTRKGGLRQPVANAFKLLHKPRRSKPPKVRQAI